jgi:hypothetical protein
MEHVMTARTATRAVLLACALTLAPAACDSTPASPAPPAPGTPAPNPYQAHVRARSYAIHLAPASTGTRGGSAAAAITITAPRDQLCWTITGLAGVPAPLFAHIHRGTSGSNGPVVVPLGTRYQPAGCARGIAPALLAAIEARPAGYYLAIHTRAQPLGAVRAQL